MCEVACHLISAFSNMVQISCYFIVKLLVFIVQKKEASFFMNSFKGLIFTISVSAIYFHECWSCDYCSDITGKGLNME